MISQILKGAATAVVCGCLSSISFAEPVTYIIDNAHTYPAFEADHSGGLSIWRGKINSTTGAIVLDKEAETGSVNIEMDMHTIDFGHEGMNNSAKDHVVNVADYPTATYTGELTDFVDGAPTMVRGSLNLHGVTKDLDLTLNSFLCKPHPRHQREVCGADAFASFDRSDYNIMHGLDNGFLPFINLLISVEAGIPAS
mgnify:CR=1 FL=1